MLTGCGSSIKLWGMGSDHFQLPPRLPLLVPVERLGEGADVDLFNCVAALGGSGLEWTGQHHRLQMFVPDTNRDAHRCRC